jgi:phosphoribosylglycinamide formyltransferase 1
MTMRIVMFSSWGPGNFQTALDFCDSRAETRLALLVSDRADTPSTRLARERGIDLFVHPIEGGYDADQPNSRHRRIAALEPVLRRLQRLEREDGPIDLIVLAFRRILAGPILDQFASRMINVHPSDLSVFNIADRKPRYVGIGGLSRAIKDGNPTTRTSVHKVTAGVDEGPVICLGPEVRFEGSRDSRRDIDAHESRQKQCSDRMALKRALEMWCRGAPEPLAIL